MIRMEASDNSFGNFGTVTTNFDTGDPMYDPEQGANSIAIQK